MDVSSYTLEPWQQRVLSEKAQLDERIARLGAFFNTDAYGRLGDAECDRLQRQHAAMVQYSAILGERIAAFPRQD